MTRQSCKEEGARAFLRPPMGNHAFYSREVLSAAKGAIMKAWATGSNNSLKRDVALTLLADPELRLRVCHLEEILRARQWTARQQANGFTSAGAAQAGKDLQLQTALADPSFAALFQLDSSINEPDWGMQVLWLNMYQLQKELGLPPTPPPPATAAQPASVVPAAAAPAAAVPSTAIPTSSPETVPDPALLTAFEAAFPNHPTDEEDYLAMAACYCLATRRDPRSLLPPLSLHLTDLTAHLRSYAAADARLNAVLQRVAVMPAASTPAARGGGPPPPPTLAARLAEVLAAAPGARLVFRQSESLSRKGERVVSLALEQLTRLSGGGGSAAAAGGGGRAGGAAGANRAHLGSGGAPPYEVWQHAGALAVNGSGGGAAAAGDRLPVFLFEYEAPSDIRDDMAAPLAAQRDQYDAAVGGSPSGRSRAAGSSPSASSSSAAATAAAVGGGGGLRPASNTSPHQAPQPLQQPQATNLQYSWSDYSKDVLDAAAAAAPPPLPSVASEPVPFRTSGDMERLGFPKVPPSTSDGGTAVVAAAAAAADLYGMPGLVLGAAWQSGGGKPSSAVDGPSPSHSFSNGLRLPMYNGNSSDKYNNHMNGTAEALLQRTIAAAAAAGGGGGPPPSMTLAAAAAAATLGASPGGPPGELHVPQEIAEVWANSGTTAAATAAGGPASRRTSVAAPLANGGGLPSDCSVNGMFAMSPTQESSYFWEGLAGRTSGQQANPMLGRIIATGHGAAADLGALGLPGFGLGYTSAGTAGLMAGGGAAGGAQLVVGSAPSVFAPPFLNGSAAATTAAGGLGGFNGLGGVAGIGSGAALMDYASWQSSSPELSGSVGGRSAPADTALAIESWMLAYGTRPPVGCGGGAAAGGRGAGQHAATAVAAVTSGADGRATVTSRGGGGGGGGPDPSPSTVSEESEEAASVVGGLDLDPMALTLEALIGLEPSSQLEGSGVSRRTTISGPGGPPGGAAKGLIAAAAAPKVVDAVAVTSSAVSGAATSPSSKSFGSVSASSANTNTDSSLDSCEVLNGGTAAGAVLTGWSAMAARGLPPSSPSAHHSTAAAAAAGMHLAPGGRVAGPQLQHGLLQQPGTAAAVMTAQGLAVTMAAMGAVAAAAAGGAAGNLAMSRQASLGHGGGGGGLLGMAGLPPPAGVTTASGAATARDVLGGKALHPRLTQRVREEICQLVRTVPGLKAEDFDDGVLHQLTLKKSEDEAVGALRTLAAENLSGIQHMAAYINHIIKNYHHLTRAAPGGGPAGAGAASLPSATVRANSQPVSSKAILQKLPLRVYRRLEELISRCSYMEWKHFDAGVVKVMAQLAEIGEDDVFEELELLKSTDLSNVEYMPAYLNKRLNNRLWSRRKMLTAASVAAVGAGGP